MTRAGDLVSIQGDAPRDGSAPASSSARPAPTYRVLAEIDDLVILRCMSGAPSVARLLMAGEIVSDTSVLEAINTISTNAWRGELVVQGSDSLRRIRFDHGAVKSATSEVASEQLGRVMVALGMLAADQLSQLSQSLAPDERIGERVMQLELVPRERLFSAMCFQAERIFQNALLVNQGFVAFVEAAASTQGAALTMHIPVHGLVMKSVQRIDEMAFFRKQIPSGEACPVTTTATGQAALPGTLGQIAVLADGSHSILDIAARLGVDEFAITKAVAQLLQQGAVRLIDKEPLDPQHASQRIAGFNEVLHCIRDAADRHGGREEMRWTLQAWMRDTTLGEFFGTELEPDGGVPVTSTIQRLARMRLERPMQRLDHALHELVSFAMFSATPALSTEQAQALNGEVAERLERMRPPRIERRTQSGLGAASPITLPLEPVDPPGGQAR